MTAALVQTAIGRPWRLAVRLVCTVLLVGASALVDGGNSAQGIQVNPSGARPQLVFACELADQPLESLFADPAVIADLMDLHAGVSLALMDMSAERAALVQRLNEAGIPVMAWITLPREQGYYLNAGNPSQAAAQFSAFEKWTAEYHLHWAAVGLDIEPNFQEIASLIHGSRWRLMRTVFARYFDTGRVVRARAAYSQLIRRMQRDGYLVQTYQFPFIADERRAHSTLLERLLGIVDVRGNQEVLMTYSSFNHAADSAVVWSYGAEAQTVAVGVVAGGPNVPLKFAPLNWDELSRDLLVASHFSHVAGIYSLEGCIHNGFLSRLRTLDWNTPVYLSPDSLAAIRRFRFRLRAVLWIGSQLPALLGASVAIIFGFVWMWWRRRRRTQNRLALQQPKHPGNQGQPDAVSGRR